MHPPLPGTFDPIAQLQARVAALETALQLSAATLRIAVGDSIVYLTKNSIEVKGRDITLSASGKITIKAGDDLVLKGAKILQN